MYVLHKYWSGEFHASVKALVSLLNNHTSYRERTRVLKPFIVVIATKIFQSNIEENILYNLVI